MSAIQELMEMRDDLPFTPTHRAARRPGTEAGHVAKLMDPDLTRAFALAGNAICTVVSRASGQRFTFKLQRPKDEDQRARRPIFVSVLAGPQNDSDYAHLGTIWEEGGVLVAYRHGAKSRIAADAPSARAAAWFAKALAAPDLLDQCEVWHEGRCGRCGRRLTVPSSIASGIGPECASIMGG